MAKKNKQSDASKAASLLGKKGGAARAKKLTAGQRSAVASAGGKALAQKTPEERAEIHQKGWETRRKNKAKK